MSLECLIVSIECLMVPLQCSMVYIVLNGGFTVFVGALQCSVPVVPYLLSVIGVFYILSLFIYSIFYVFI